MRTSLQGPSVPVHPTGLLRRVRPRIASSGDASSSPGQGNLLLGMRCPYRYFFVVFAVRGPRQTVVLNRDTFDCQI